MRAIHHSQTNIDVGLRSIRLFIDLSFFFKNLSNATSNENKMRKRRGITSLCTCNNKFIVYYSPHRPIGALGWRVPQDESFCQDCQLRRSRSVQQQRHLSRHLIHGLFLCIYLFLIAYILCLFIVFFVLAFVPVHLLRVGQRQ
jgi:hypothetical protein